MIIPPEVASRSQISAETALRSVAPSQEIADKLSDLVPGQRVFAEIQSLLPNGTYRALINQRSVTLALPFAAKSGDTLEMVVTENEGKVALAVAERSGAASPNTAESAASTLSRAGQLISQLLSGARAPGQMPAPLTLNESRPLTLSPAEGGAAFAPALKQALIQSGFFYESHQAEWVQGRFAQAALLREPQGRLSSPLAFAVLQEGAEDSEHAAGAPNTAGKVSGQTANAPEKAMPETLPARTESAERQAFSHVRAFSPVRLYEEESGARSAVRGGAGVFTPTTGAAAGTAGQAVAPSAQGLVQQQLEALASQKFIWQGQVWPGQDMFWEIGDDEPRRAPDEEEEAEGHWSTRVRMDLPRLGVIDIGVRLQGDQVSLSVHTALPDTRDQMRAAHSALQAQMNEAGLTLASMGVEADASAQGAASVRDGAEGSILPASLQEAAAEGTDAP